MYVAACRVSVLAPHVTGDHATWFPALQSSPRCWIFKTHCERSILPMLLRRADPNRPSEAYCLL